MSITRTTTPTGMPPPRRPLGRRKKMIRLDQGKKRRREPFRPVEEESFQTGVENLSGAVRLGESTPAGIPPGKSGRGGWTREAVGFLRRRLPLRLKCWLAARAHTFVGAALRNALTSRMRSSKRELLEDPELFLDRLRRGRG
jgi:hypothetical protein